MGLVCWPVLLRCPYLLCSGSEVVRRSKASMHVALKFGLSPQRKLLESSLWLPSQEAAADIAIVPASVSSPEHGLQGNPTVL